MKYHNQPQKICSKCGGIKTALHRTNANGICYNIHKSSRNARQGLQYYKRVVKSRRATNVDRDSLVTSIKNAFKRGKVKVVDDKKVTQ